MRGLGPLQGELQREDVSEGLRAPSPGLPPHSKLALAAAPGRSAWRAHWLLSQAGESK